MAIGVSRDVTREGETLNDYGLLALLLYCFRHEFVPNLYAFHAAMVN
jgi:hypothetical protein